LRAASWSAWTAKPPAIGQSEQLSGLPPERLQEVQGSLNLPAPMPRCSRLASAWVAAWPPFAI